MSIQKSEDMFFGELWQLPGKRPSLRYRKRWSEDEVAFLRENYESLSYHVLSKQLGRTFEATKKKAQLLGLAPKCLSAEVRQNWHPNSIEYQVLIGSLLGDGCVSKVKTFIEGHSLDQRPYLYWKADLLTQLRPKLKIFDRKPGWTFKKRKAIMMQTRSFDYFSELRQEWYPQNKKVIPKSIWQIEPLGLAIWFQDDGSNDKTGFRIASHAFSRDDHLRLKRVLQEKFRVKADIRQQTVQGNHFFYLRMNKKPAKRFEELIKPHVHLSMQYKLH